MCCIFINDNIHLPYDVSQFCSPLQNVSAQRSGGQFQYTCIWTLLHDCCIKNQANKKKKNILLQLLDG